MRASPRAHGPNSTRQAWTNSPPSTRSTPRACFSCSGSWPPRRVRASEARSLGVRRPGGRSCRARERGVRAGSPVRVPEVRCRGCPGGAGHLRHQSVVVEASLLVVVGSEAGKPGHKEHAWLTTWFASTRLASSVRRCPGIFRTRPAGCLPRCRSGDVAVVRSAVSAKVGIPRDHGAQVQDADIPALAQQAGLGAMSSAGSSAQAAAETASEQRTAAETAEHRAFLARDKAEAAERRKNSTAARAKALEAAAAAAEGTDAAAEARQAATEARTAPTTRPVPPPGPVPPLTRRPPPR